MESSETTGGSHLALAWLAHLYTATGGLLGMTALFLAAEGRVRETFVLLVVACLVDATDGLLARRIGVADQTPRFSGAQLDDAVDVLTYIWVPVFVMGSQHLLPHPGWLAAPILAALYAYGQTDMKSKDGFFLGFPSYWNIIALYLYWLRPSPSLAVLVVMVPSFLSFIPTRYLYPSRNSFLWKSSWGLGALWAGLILFLLLQETPDRRLVVLSLFYPIYYVGASFYAEHLYSRRESIR